MLGIYSIMASLTGYVNDMRRNPIKPLSSVVAAVSCKQGLGALAANLKLSARKFVQHVDQELSIRDIKSRR